MSWTRIAEQAAVDIQEQVLNLRRGAVAWRRPGLAVAFGNDGYTQDERTHRAVNWLRHNLPRWGAPVLAVGTSDDGYTWTLLVETDRIDWLNHLVWRSWGEANPLEPLAWRGQPAVCPPIHWSGPHDVPACEPNVAGTSGALPRSPLAFRLDSFWAETGGAGMLAE
jgi:hypothetical protein